MKKRLEFVCAMVALVLTNTGMVIANDDIESRLQAISAALLNPQNGSEKHEVGFREQRYSELLAKPVVFQGQLIYEPITRVMSKVVTHPQAVSMTMTDQAVLVETDEGKRRLSLRARPALRAILTGFRALVEGDVEALKSHFELGYEQSNDSWELLLTPRHPRLARRLTSLTVSGQGTRIDNIVTLMSNGDRQHMTLYPVITDGQ